MAMRTSLLVGLTDEEQTQLRTEFASCRTLRRKLVEELTKDVTFLQDQMLEIDPTQTSDWAMQQAIFLYEIKALKKLIRFLED